MQEEELIRVLKRFMAEPDYMRAVNNGPGMCVSTYPLSMLQRLAVPVTNYIPYFLNLSTLLGEISIRHHLTTHHGLTSRRVERIRDDNCYRLHDLLHAGD